MTEGINSDWYIAVNEEGRYSTRRGVARTRIVPDLLVCEFFLDDGETRFGSFRGEIGAGSKIIGTLLRDDGRPAEVPLRGYHFQEDDEKHDNRLRPEVDVSIMLSDGWVTMGVAQKAPL
jgi:hypothetical protein